MPEFYLHGVQVVESDEGRRPISTLRSSTIGCVGLCPALGENARYNQPILIDSPDKASAFLGDGPALDYYRSIYLQGACEVVVVPVAPGATTAENFVNIAGDAAKGTGVWALEHAPARTGLTPKICIAPRPGAVENLEQLGGVTAQLGAFAKKSRAIAIVDGPNTNEAEALQYRENFGGDHIYLVDPGVIEKDADGLDALRPASPHVAGVIAVKDIQKGFWQSPDNTIIQGIQSAARPIGFIPSRPDCEANRLNEKGVATIIRHQGFRLWGARSTAADPLWAFLNVRRCANVIYDSIEAAHMWAVGKIKTEQLKKDIIDSVNNFGARLVFLGALAGFKTWYDPKLNNSDSLQQGKFYINFEFEPVAPIEHLIFRARRNPDFYDETFEQGVR